MTTEPVLDPGDLAAPLDALLVDAALGPMRRFAPNVSTARFVASLARRARTTGGRLGSLTAEMGGSWSARRRSARRSGTAGSPIPAWSQSPLLRRMVQAYLAAGRTADQLVGDAELDWRDEERTRFLVTNLV
jgi:polyhydroxyalkanoate synthase subunit PhaC